MWILSVVPTGSLLSLLPPPPSKHDVFRLHDLSYGHVSCHIHIPSSSINKNNHFQIQQITFNSHSDIFRYIQMLSIILNSHSVFMPKELLNASTPIVLLRPFRLPAGQPFCETACETVVKLCGFRKRSHTAAKHLCICRTCHRAVRARWYRSCTSAAVTS